MDKVAATINSYDRTAQQYAEKTANLLRQELIQKFCAIVPRGKILDLGCGPGRDANVLANKGYDVTGIDLSLEMLRIARYTAPHARFAYMDQRRLNFDNDSFQGIWALASFLHVPKAEIPGTLGEAHRVLKKGGGIHIGIKAGVGEEFLPDTRYGKDIMKFYSYFEPGELEAAMEQEGFKILDATSVERDTNGYLSHPEINIFARKE